MLARMAWGSPIFGIKCAKGGGGGNCYLSNARIDPATFSVGLPYAVYAYVKELGEGIGRLLHTSEGTLKWVCKIAENALALIIIVIFFQKRYSGQQPTSGCHIISERCYK